MEKSLQSTIESILFAAGEPVSMEKLAVFLELELADFKQKLEQLTTQYQQTDSGLALVIKDDQVQLVSAKENAISVAKFLNRELAEDLSPAAAEVLAVVAYRGPITRAQIEQIRGVNCSFTLRNLAIRGLVERIDNPTDSRSFLYRISFDFLKTLGLNTIDQLPEYQDLSKAELPQLMVTDQSAAKLDVELPKKNIADKSVE